MTLRRKIKVLNILRKMNLTPLTSRKTWSVVAVAVLGYLAPIIGLSTEQLSSSAEVLTALILGLGVTDAWRNSALSLWQRLASGRVWMAAASVAIITLAEQLGLSPEAAQWLAHAATAYIGAATITRLANPLPATAGTPARDLGH
jgi:hypothetical protein